MRRDEVAVCGHDILRHLDNAECLALAELALADGIHRQLLNFGELLALCDQAYKLRRRPDNAVLGRNALIDELTAHILQCLQCGIAGQSSRLLLDRAVQRELLQRVFVLVRDNNGFILELDPLAGSSAQRAALCRAKLDNAGVRHVLQHAIAVQVRGDVLRVAVAVCCSLAVKLVVRYSSRYIYLHHIYSVKIQAAVGVRFYKGLCKPLLFKAAVKFTGKVVSIMEIGRHNSCSFTQNLNALRKSASKPLSSPVPVIEPGLVCLFV